MIIILYKGKCRRAFSHPNDWDFKTSMLIILYKGNAGKQLIIHIVETLKQCPKQ